jgi:hypothetical protein
MIAGCCLPSADQLSAFLRSAAAEWLHQDATPQTMPVSTQRVAAVPTSQAEVQP